MKVKVFISWSGPMSQAVAEALRDWLPSVIQAVEPWTSTETRRGARWSLELVNQLEQARIGLICLTPENLESPWIHFEVGALSRTLEDTYVCPYLFQVKPTDLKRPLAQFQIAKAEKEDTRKLVRTINQTLGDETLPEAKLDEAFDLWWPRLEERLGEIPRMSETESQRSDRERIEEMAVKTLDVMERKKRILERLKKDDRVKKFLEEALTRPINDDMPNDT